MKRWSGKGQRGTFRDDGFNLDFRNGFTGVHQPIFIKLFSLNICSLLCVNYNPIKLLQKKKEKKAIWVNKLLLRKQIASFP